MQECNRKNSSGSPYSWLQHECYANNCGYKQQLLSKFLPQPLCQILWLNAANFCSSASSYLPWTF